MLPAMLWAIRQVFILLLGKLMTWWEQDELLPPLGELVADKAMIAEAKRAKGTGDSKRAVSCHSP